MIDSLFKICNMTEQFKDLSVAFEMTDSDSSRNLSPLAGDATSSSL